MPAKLERCIKSVMESGKSEESAYAICNAQLKDTVSGEFRDSAVFDPKERTAISVRDGVLEYLGAELGMVPADRIVRVYRSPATIANTAMKMRGIPITDEHVSLDLPAPSSGGFVADAEMMDAHDPATASTIAIRNKLAISDTLGMAVEAGKRELSLGYMADLVPYEGDEDFDFEQRNIAPHHLATVERGRCGSTCSFIDRKPIIEEEDAMSLHKAFKDQEGQLNLQQVVEMAMALPEAIKAVPVDQLQQLVEPLQAIIEAAKAAGVTTPVEEQPIEPTEPTEPMEDENMPEEDKPKFSDAAVTKMVQTATDSAVKRHAAVIEKARDFLPEDYKFADKATTQIMKDAVGTQTNEQFTDAELGLAFKLLKPAAADYRKFGDAEPDAFATLKNKEL